MTSWFHFSLKTNEYIIYLHFQLYTVLTHMKYRSSTMFAKAKTIFLEKNKYSVDPNLWPLELYNGPFQVYCINPEGRIH